MKRYVWLLLLVSLGLNLGLGWRLFNQVRQSDADWRTEHFRDGDDRSGRTGRGEGRRGGRGGDGKISEFIRPAPGDSNAWREVMEHRLERVARRLDLAPEQVESFREAHRATGAIFRGQRMHIKQTENRLMELTMASPVDPDSIRITVRELGRSKARLDSLVTEALLKELDTLTPEQREKYLHMLPWSRSGMERGPGSGRDGRRNPSPEPPPPGE